MLMLKGIQLIFGSDVLNQNKNAQHIFSNTILLYYYFLVGILFI